MPNRKQAEIRYREIRHQARTSIIEELRELSSPAVALTDITDEALIQAEAWRTVYPLATHGYIPGWDWRVEVRKFRRRPRRIEVALWHGETLCGLALGRISDKCVVATVHFVESMPRTNPLQGLVAPFIVRYLEAVAVTVGCRAVSLERPVEELVGYYQAMGFGRTVKKGSRILRLVKHLPTIPIGIL